MGAQRKASKRRLVVAVRTGQGSAALDRDGGFQEEVRNAARSLVEMVRLIRGGRYAEPDRGLRNPRPK